MRSGRKHARHTGFHDADGGLGGKRSERAPSHAAVAPADPRPAPVRPAVNVNICQRSYVGDGNADARAHDGGNFAVEGAVNPACCRSASPSLREQVRKVRGAFPFFPSDWLWRLGCLTWHRHCCVKSGKAAAVDLKADGVCKGPLP